MATHVSEDQDGTQSPSSLQLTDNLSSPIRTRPSWTKTFLWPPMAAMAVVSSKNLFEQQNFHFPFRLLALQEIAALLMIIFPHVAPQWVFTAFPSRLRPLLARTEIIDSLFHSKSIPLVPAAVLLSLSLILYSQAILHFPNIVTLLMLAPLLVPLETFFAFLIHNRGIPKDIAVYTLFSMLTVGLVLYDDYRLTVNGLIFGVLALVFSRIAKASRGYGNETTGTASQNNCYSSGRNIVVLAMILNAPVLATCSYAFEFSHIPQTSASSQFYPVFAFAIATGAISLILGGSVETSLEDLNDSSNASFSGFPSFLRLALDCARSGIAAWLSNFACQRGYTTWLQAVVYIIGICGLADNWILRMIVGRSLYGPTASSNESIARGEQVNVEYYSLPNHDSARGRPGPLERTNGDVLNHRIPKRDLQASTLTRSITIVLLVVGLSSWATYMQANFLPTSGRRLEMPRPSLDLDYQPSSQLDIVISMYRESKTSVSSVISRITQIDVIAKTSPRVIVYTKDEDAEASQLQQALGAFEVIKLPNEGRESETYLHHVLRHWDNLAEHTLFMQADIHNPREFYPRVRDYFKFNTGMLSLGFSGNVCDCRNCGDRWGWSDTSGVLLDVYKDANKLSCGPMLLSYKGQFIASAQRIRGVERKVYEELRQALVDPESWAHQQKYLQGRPDSMNAPYFGYTMERLWSTLLQCSDMDIAWKCPTLLSGSRRGGDAGDCQCFDEIAPE